MGFRFRKSIKIGPARVNLSKSGVGYSVGTKGFRVTKKAGGGTRTTASIPGTGISYTKDSSSKKKTSSSPTKKSTPKSTTITPARASAPHKKSLLTAIIAAIIAFGMVGGGSLIALAIVIGIISAFVYIPAGLFWGIVIALAAILGGAAAYFMFRNEKPEEKTLKENEVSEATTEAPVKPESEVKTYRVAGVAHYLDNLMSMMEPNYLYGYKKQELIDACCTNENVYKQTVNTDQLELVPEPTNTHDPNAIMVQLGGKLVGYIPAKDCEHVLKVIRDGRIISLTCKVEGGKYKMVDEDYDCMKDKSTYRMETGEDPYGITVYIREKL